MSNSMPTDKKKHASANKIQHSKTKEKTSPSNVKFNQQKKKKQLSLHPILVQICRAGDRFEIGDGPIHLQKASSLVLGRGIASEIPSTKKTSRLNVDDAWMSFEHARLISFTPHQKRAVKPRLSEHKSNGVWIEDLGSTNGILVNGVLVKRCLLRPYDIIETGRTFWVYIEEYTSENTQKEPVEFGAFTSWTPAVQTQLRTLQKIASTTKHVLLTGEYGTGKGFLARSLHRESEKKGRFLHLDCRERSEKQLRADLFGTRSPVSRKRKKGRLLDAKHGTLFLENADALSTKLQFELAAVLSSGCIQNNEEKHKLSMRVVLTASISSRKKRKEVFVPQLLEQIKGAQLHLPPLVERRADFGFWVDDVFARAKGANAIDRDALRALILHSFDHHLKDFMRVLESAAALSLGATVLDERSGCIHLRHLPASILGIEELQRILEEMRDTFDSAPKKKAQHPFLADAPVPLADVHSAEKFLDDDEDPTQSSLPHHLQTSDKQTSESGKRSSSENSSENVWKTQLPNNNAQLEPSSLKKGSVSEAHLHLSLNDVDIPTSELSAAPISNDFLNKLADIESFVEHFDAAEPTNPVDFPRLDAKLNPLQFNQTSPRPRRKGVRSIESKTKSPQRILPEERPPSMRFDLDQLERSYANVVDPDLIIEALKRNAGNVSAAARSLGKPRALLQKWMKEFGIRAADHRS